MRGDAHYRQQHTAHALRGCACDNCQSMCVMHHGRKIRVEEYWCDTKHRTITELPKQCEKRRQAS